MKRTVRKAAAWLLAVCFCCLSGCGFISMNADNLLRAPKLTGDRAGVQQAVDHYIAERIGTDKPDYTLKYPKEGDNLTSFLFLDGEQDPTRAVAFYCCPAQSVNTRILYLEKRQGEWVGLVDAEGNSEDIGQVFLGDVDADGHQELLVGWNIYTMRDRRLTVYDVAPTADAPTVVALYDTSYTAMMVANVTESKADDLILFNIVTTEAHVSARLLSYEQGSFREISSARLDGAITRFSNGQVVSLQGKSAVFIDGHKDSNTTVTELLIWDGVSLQTPFYDAVKNLTSLTARESGLPCADVDGDGVPEYPISQRLPGYEETELADTLWQTTYYKWNVQTAQSEAVLTAVVNATDGYLLVLDELLRDQVTAQYDKRSRVLELSLSESGEVLMRVLVCGIKQELPQGYRSLRKTDRLHSAFWVPDSETAPLTPEQALYMIAFI